MALARLKNLLEFVIIVLVFFFVVFILAGLISSTRYSYFLSQALRSYD